MDWGGLEAGSKTAVAGVFFAVTRANLEPVVIFFVLSGMLVGGKVIERVLSGDFNVPAYVLDRFSRIYIPLFPALILSGVVAWQGGNVIRMDELVGNIASLQSVVVAPFAGNAPLWSLSYEVWFYVVAGSAAAAISLRASTSFAAFLVLFWALLICAKLEAVLFYCWLLGALGFSLTKVRLPNYVLGCALFLTALGAVGSQLSMKSQSAVFDVAWLPSRATSVLAMSAGCAVLFAWLATTRVTSRLMSRIQALGTSLAAFSYTLYLTHYPVLQVWEKFSPERRTALDVWSFAVFFAKIGSCLFIGWLLYLPFERRTGKFREWVRDHCCLVETASRH